MSTAETSTRRNLIAWLYLTPNFSGFLVFTLIPVLVAFLLSLFRWDIFHAPVFVGLGNFVDLLGFSQRGGSWVAHDPEFWQYLGNTLFLMVGLPVSMLVSLLIAMLLNRELKGIGFFRTVFYLPTICGGVGMLLLWGFIFAPEIGLMNRILNGIGLPGAPWLTDYYWAKPTIMLISFWGAVGGTNMLLYLAGLQGIPQELYEAAKVDGAGRVQQFFHITLPMLAPTNFFIFVMGVIGGFQGGFDAAFVLTRGGPAGATTTLSYYIYNHAFNWFNMGYAAAISLVLFALVLLVTVVNWKMGGKNDEA
jgi:multiple sugar transport system permease protein